MPDGTGGRLGGALTIRQRCFPERARPVPGARALSLVLRALHLLAVAFLLGGHGAGASAESLLPWLVLALGSGAGLVVPEILTWGLYWFLLAKGVAVVAKLALLLIIPFAWEARVPILVLALVGAALTSHMPARLRNYSLLHGRVLDPAGPLSRARAPLAPEGRGS